jgi:hypothetical protein
MNIITNSITTSIRSATKKRDRDYNNYYYYYHY